MLGGSSPGRPCRPFAGRTLASQSPAPNHTPEGQNPITSSSVKVAGHNVGELADRLVDALIRAWQPRFRQQKFQRGLRRQRQRPRRAIPPSGDIKNPCCPRYFTSAATVAADRISAWSKCRTILLLILKLRRSPNPFQ